MTTSANDASRHIELHVRVFFRTARIPPKRVGCRVRPKQPAEHGTSTFVGISREIVRDEICCRRTYTMRINDIILERGENERHGKTTENSVAFEYFDVIWKPDLVPIFPLVPLFP